MKLKKWLAPLVSLLITLAPIFISVIILCFIDHERYLDAMTVIILISSHLWVVSIPILSFFYAFLFLKRSKGGVLFSLYNALILSISFIIPIFGGAGMALFFTPIMFAVSFVSALIGIAVSPSEKRNEEYTPQFPEVHT